jgi:hypothetical protein
MHFIRAVFQANNCSTIPFPSLPYIPFFPFPSLPLSSMIVMLLVTAVASFVVLATRVAAEPSNHRRSQPVSLSITKHIDPQGKYYPVQRDWRRFTSLMNEANQVSSLNLAEETAELPLTDAGPCYEAKVGVGIPPTYCKSCVDFLSGI